MDPARFSASPGRFVSTVDGLVAFVPPPLPPPLDLSQGLVAALDEASAAVGELAGVTRRMANPGLLIAPYLRREAVLSSRIEGTQSTLTDLYQAEAGQTTLFETTDVKEVTNYVDALEHGWSRLARLPLSKRLIRELHERLMRDVRGQDQRPGEFRRSQNFIGSASATIETATYVPPPVEQMHEALDDLERFLHADRLQPLLVAGIAHGQFEAIHPFRDGNGRIGRLLIPLILHARDRLPQPVLYLSGYLERTRSEYYDRLLRISADGDWEGWLIYFLEGVRAQARAAVADADRLVGLERDLRERLYAARARPTAIQLIDHLFVNPIVTARRASELLGVSNPAARSAIAILEELRILREFTGGSYGRRWVADQVLAAIEGPST